MKPTLQLDILYLSRPWKSSRQSLISVIFMDHLAAQAKIRMKLTTRKVQYLPRFFSYLKLKDSETAVKEFQIKLLLKL